MEFLLLFCSIFGLLFGVESLLSGAMPINPHVECTCTHIERPRPKRPQQQKYKLGRLRFTRRGASTPLWGVEACSLSRRWPNPTPAIPPFVVRTPHLHGAPTTEETVELQLSVSVWFQRLSHNLAGDRIDPNSLFHDLAVRFDRVAARPSFTQLLS